MSEERTRKNFSAIDVGSNSIRMKIAEVAKDCKIKVLESARYPVDLGRDTFSIGKISFSTLIKTSEILQGFKKLMGDYRVKEYRAVATNALREAQNRDYVLDQIKLKTGLDIEIINNSLERFYTAKALRDKLSNYTKLRREGVLILDIGSGSTSISVYSNNMLIYSYNLKLGSLRLSEILAAIEERNLDYPVILQDFIRSDVDRLQTFEPETIRANNMIAIGGNNDLVGRICSHNISPELNIIERATFEKVYREILTTPAKSFQKKHKVPPERVKTILPSMIILRTFLEKTRAQEIINPVVSLRDGVISDSIDRSFHHQQDEDFYEDIIVSARFIASRYKYDQAHAEDVEKNSLILFDKLRKLHGLKERHRFYLKVAAILHDTGKYLSLNEHYVHSYHLIKAADLLGVSEEELEIIANIARYHSIVVPDKTAHPSFEQLSGKNKVVVAKLVAIIRLADSLDRSHQQKIEVTQVSLNGAQLEISGSSRGNTLLEEWTFQFKAEFFKEVFGIKPILQVKRML